MRTPEVTVLSDGRLSIKRTILRECESYTAPLPDFLARLDSHLPTEADRRNAYITVTDAGIIVSTVHVETDAERSTRLQKVADEAQQLLDASRARAASAAPV